MALSHHSCQPVPRARRRAREAARAAPRRRTPRWQRIGVAAVILTVALGCDKAKGLATGRSGSRSPDPPAAERLDLSARPDLLFQVFGEREDPRMLPVAAIVGGELRPIVLTAAGWRQLDAMYTRAGMEYSVYRDGRVAGMLRVRQGMWEKPDEPLYSLPNCERMVPLAAVSLDEKLTRGFTVELLASSGQIASSATGEPLKAAQAERIAREVGARAAAAAGIEPAALARLDFRAVGVRTGATGSATVIATYIDPDAADETQATAHVFAIADRDASGAYKASYTHVSHGRASNAEYRRYLDHLDLDRDGVDEIVLEGWRYGGDNFFVVLERQGGAWRETFRAGTSWCLDAT